MPALCWAHNSCELSKSSRWIPCPPLDRWETEAQRGLHLFKVTWPLWQGQGLKPGLCMNSVPDPASGDVGGV